MATFTIRYFSDIVRHHETQPCAHNGRTFPTAEEAERVARAELPAVRSNHGSKVGFAIFEDNGRVAAIGPGSYDDA